MIRRRIPQTTNGFINARAVNVFPTRKKTNAAPKNTIPKSTKYLDENISSLAHSSIIFTISIFLFFRVQRQNRTALLPCILHLLTAVVETAFYCLTKVIYSIDPKGESSSASTGSLNSVKLELKVKVVASGVSPSSPME